MKYKVLCEGVSQKHDGKIKACKVGDIIEVSPAAVAHLARRGRALGVQFLGPATPPRRLRTTLTSAAEVEEEVADD